MGGPNRGDAPKRVLEGGKKGDESTGEDIRKKKKTGEMN